MIGLEHYLTVAASLFVIGIFGLFLNRKNVIILLMFFEFFGRFGRTGFYAFCVDGRRRRGCDWPGHFGQFLPQSRHHCR